MHIHMYFFCVRRCRRPVAAADVDFFEKSPFSDFFYGVYDETFAFENGLIRFSENVLIIFALSARKMEFLQKSLRMTLKK